MSLLRANPFPHSSHPCCCCCCCCPFSTGPATSPPRFFRPCDLLAVDTLPTAAAAPAVDVDACGCCVCKAVRV
ncbi:hypothetical protein HETIRDRAFT_122344 [Heterobasidion irregulare TC 32-1]|uniref:Uncharacterized protein n=1 Tax=Heterobasidion irregulare (strain TC 32-1) TaxID=747525 RepID=W4KJP1_HETIT|nr:uncharacterized protein HETIRDRAFT_122344 [Heterobasidion irregulare TC 32-1]ETW85914.1 hypothetical protein HETIRDRAFT_122344 [Heterobasidion irregulare TC 32-1]